MKQEFKIGDVVWLRSGGPALTVIRATNQNLALLAIEGNQVIELNVPADTVTLAQGVCLRCGERCDYCKEGK